MALLHYVSHPAVHIDPEVSVDRWGLSDEGRRAATAMLDASWVSSVGRIVSSAETKAMETAELLAERLGLDVEVRPQTGENDRSATGFVPPEEFEQLADAFFARPTESVSGWERAVDAQNRIVDALADLLVPSAEADVAVVGHGGVGTLWYCHLSGQSIDRRHDQPGQGHRFVVDLGTGRPIDAWRPIIGG